MDDIRERMIRVIVIGGGFIYSQKVVRQMVAKVADQLLNIKCSRGGGVCPTCLGLKGLSHQRGTATSGNRGYIEPCPTCKGTGFKPIETKEIKEIIKEWENGKTNNAE